MGAYCPSTEENLNKMINIMNGSFKNGDILMEIETDNSIIDGIEEVVQCKWLLKRFVD